MKRRELLKYIGLTAGTVALSGSASIVSAAEQSSKSKRVLRIAHITDVHIRPEENAPDRICKMFRRNKET